jgi:BirA family transcriptional regulator, biotin operon repressor / biotin---[acetyl-CoA-carboxylase] ligase
MYQKLFIGNKLKKLEEVDSTNSYAKQLLLNDNDVIEGLVIVAESQSYGRGQMGNKWVTESGKNLTFSIILKPNLEVSNQFMLSKTISLGIVDFLIDAGFENIKIKWPNDIYVNDTKIAGILIENTLKGKNIDYSVVGVGLNVNQLKFDSGLTNPTSMRLIKDLKYNLDDLLNKLLFFIERRYLALKSNNQKLISADYLEKLYRINELNKFEVNKVVVEAKIIAIAKSGKLRLDIAGKENEFDLKEVKFIV